MSNFAMIAVEIKNEFATGYEANLKAADLWKCIDRVYRGKGTSLYVCNSWNHYNDQLAGSMIPEEADIEDWRHCWIDEYSYADEGCLDGHICVDLSIYDTDDYIIVTPKEE